ncbi:metastasis-associated protein MTA1 [Daktulosphaira vitifoliae]|uniref:metastasis-associated protein MTA1 n=1 Tax=Daktulosphaira vitifoliae TaxID=58002 RepID=UPI0021A992B1|nr:metastasis-associated protein MTA1 [Daktulosphaira vitifoliae]
MTANMYRVGDYVYFETSNGSPFQIRRIEELNKTANGNVEAKVMCFFRRCDLPSTLIVLADKHQQVASSTLDDCRGIKKNSVMSIKPGKDGSTQQQDSVKDSNSNENDENPVAMDCTSATDGEETKGYLTTLSENDSNIKKIDAPNSLLQHRLKQRELFLSRQVETLPATHIRGKCFVTLYNETESFESYLNKEDTFFYCLVFDPNQKTLLADKGEIRVGHKYQVENLPTPNSSKINTNNATNDCCENNGVIEKSDNDNRDIAELETLVWTSAHQLTDRQIDQFLVISRSLGTFARALDCSSSVKQPSLHMSAAAASRDITLFHAMDTLHRHGYDLGAATCSLVPSTGPVLCRDEMEEWSASEANLFEEALEKYGKDFSDIRHDFLPWKTQKNIVEYYYMWKTTDRYVQQKRVKAVEAESKLKQVYIPNYNNNNKNQQITGSSTAAIKSSAHHNQMVNGNSNALELYGSAGKNSSGISTPGQCDSCDATMSTQWYPWSNSNSNGIGSTFLSTVTLCHDCWTYWKKYGGLKSNGGNISKKSATITNSGSISGDEDRPLSNASATSLVMNQNNQSGGSGNNPKSIQQQLYTAPHRCTIIGCGKEFKVKAQLLRHYSGAHGIGIRGDLVVPGPGGTQPQVQQQPQTLQQHQNHLLSGSAGVNLSQQQQGINFGVSSGQNAASNQQTGGGVGGRPVMKTRTAFYLRSTPLAKAARKACSLHKIPGSVTTGNARPQRALRPRHVARSPFSSIPVAHTVKQECQLQLQNKTNAELKAYLKSLSGSTGPRVRQGVTMVANALAASRNRELTVPEWLRIGGQTHKQNKYLAFPKPPKAPDGSLMYERVPNKEQLLHIQQQQLQQGGGFIDLYNTNSKRRNYEESNGVVPQAGPPSKRMHRTSSNNSVQPSSLTNATDSSTQRSSTNTNVSPSSAQASAAQQLFNSGVPSNSAAAVAAAINHLSHNPLLAQLGATSGSGTNQAQNQQQLLNGTGVPTGATTQCTKLPTIGRTPSMQRTGRKHVISWTDAPDDLYYLSNSYSKTCRKQMTGKELRRAARKPWRPIQIVPGVNRAGGPPTSNAAMCLAMPPSVHQQPPTIADAISTLGNRPIITASSLGAVPSIIPPVGILPPTSATPPGLVPSSASVLAAAGLMQQQHTTAIKDFLARAGGGSGH